MKQTTSVTMLKTSLITQLLTSSLASVFGHCMESMRPVDFPALKNKTCQQTLNTSPHPLRGFTKGLRYSVVVVLPLGIRPVP